MNNDKIAIFLPNLGGGGAERMMVSLAEGLCEQGASVDLVLCRAEGPFLSQVSPKVRIVDLRVSRSLAGIPALVRYLRRETPTALLSALDDANIVALIARAISGVRTRVVVSVRCTLSRRIRVSPMLRDRLVPFLVRCLYPGADGVVAVSEGVAEDLRRIAPVPSERVHIIYNPTVTPALYQKAGMTADHPWFAPGEPPVILGVGRLMCLKDYPTLIRAFAQVRRSKAVRLMILGEGEERAHLEALANELGVAEDVGLPGFVENPYAYMARAGLFVLSSTSEGLPNALIEAMACGTPVVATDCESGPREILENGRWGQLVPVGDAEKLAQAIQATLEQPLDPDSLKQRGGMFSVTASAAQYLQVLRGAAG